MLRPLKRVSGSVTQSFGIGIPIRCSQGSDHGLQASVNLSLTRCARADISATFSEKKQLKNFVATARFNPVGGPRSTAIAPPPITQKPPQQAK